MSPEVTTLLEMRERPQLVVTRPHRAGMLLRLEEASVGFYRFLHDQAGTQRSRSRLSGDDDAVFTRLVDPLIDVFVLFMGGAPAGFFELDRRVDGEVEVVHTGLLSEFQGRGLGKYLVATAVDTAWDEDPSRVWTSACGDDDPRGLLLYQWSGFIPYATTDSEG
jgi:GNAT superfamily N-acetyltransferase